MAVSENNYTGNGSTTLFTLTFPYLAAADVKVSLDAVDTTAFTLSNATTVSMNSAPGSGVAIRIYRDSDSATSTALATFAAGSAIKSADLNNNFTQAKYISQEAESNISVTAPLTKTGHRELALAISAATTSAAGSMSAADKTKLDAIEASATADQTASEIKTLYESNSDTNAFTDADHTKLDGIEASATADQTAAEIRTLVESASDSNVFTDADHTKLNGIEASATADQTAAEIRTLVDSATDSNVFTDADHTKLDGIATGAQVNTVTSLVAGTNITLSPVNGLGDVTIAAAAPTVADGSITSAKIADGAIVDADVNASAAISLSKLATGALPSAITVASANITDGTIVNADVNASAAIAGTKISPDFGSQNIVTTGTGDIGDDLTIADKIVHSGDTNTAIRFPSADTVSVETAGSERLRVDSSGQLGLGTTSPSQKLDVRGSVYIGTNLQVDGTGTFGNDLTVPDKIIHSGDTDTSIRFPAPDTVTVETAGTERFRVDSAGAVLIGTSTPSSITSRLLSVGNTSLAAGFLELRNSTTGQGGVVWSDGTGSGDESYRGQVGYVHGGDYLYMSTAGTEKVRILNNGDLISLNGENGISSRSTLSAGTTNTTFIGQHSASSITSATWSCKIFTNGNIQNTNNSYGQLSDIKLKENIVDASSQWDDIKNVQVRNFNFKVDQTQTQIGVVAQEIEAVSPGLIYEVPDRDEDDNILETSTKAVKYSVLYMKAIKALQEAMTRIETLETEVAALKSA